MAEVMLFNYESEYYLWYSSKLCPVVSRPPRWLLVASHMFSPRFIALHSPTTVHEAPESSCPHAHCTKQTHRPLALYVLVMICPNAVVFN